MNYQILIVDDESVDLEWMTIRIQNSGKRLEVAASVNSALAALEVIREGQVDIVLSDISMPMISGMEFIGRVRQLYPQIRVMFISGHKQFEYAKQAVDFNAFCYLLKPVEDQELWEKLDAVIADLDQEQDRYAESVRLKETFSLVRAEMIFRWLEGGYQELESSAEQALGEEAAASGMAAAIVEVDQLDWRTARNYIVDWQAQPGQILAYVEQYVKEYKLGYCIQGERQRRTMLLIGEPPALLEQTNALINAVSLCFPLTISVGLGFYTNDYRQLPLSYQASVKALGSKWQAGKNKILQADTDLTTLSSQNYSADSKAEWTELLYALEEYQLTEIDNWIEALFQPFQAGASRNTVIQQLVHTLIQLKEQLHNLNESFDELTGWETAVPNDLLECETQHDMKSWLRRELFACSEKWMLKKQNHKRKLVVEIMSYTEAQADRTITLRHIAEQFGFSANYLGHLFKQETGQHFSSYVTEQSIRKACQLLQNPTLKIYEIAEQVGYKNSIYFNRQFKKLMGMTPAVYRKRLGI